MNKSNIKKIFLVVIFAFLLVFASSSGSKTNDALEKVSITAPTANQTVEEVKAGFCRDIENALYVNPEIKKDKIAYSVQFDKNNDLIISVSSDQWYDVLNNGKKIREKIKDTISEKLAEAKNKLGEENISGKCKMTDPLRGVIESF